MTSVSRALRASLVLTLALAGSGCQDALSALSQAPLADATSKRAAETGASTGASTGAATGGTTRGIAPTSPRAAASSAPALAPMPPSGALVAGASADEAMSGPVSNGIAVGEPNPSTPSGAVPLSAGAVDDNAKFADYMRYLADYRTKALGKPMRAYDISQRHLLRVVDADGHGVSNAQVVVKLGEETLFTGKSYADGQLLFHASAYAQAEQANRFSVTATHGEQTLTQAFEAAAEGVWELKLQAPVAVPASRLDVAFVLDATGSMGGEIFKLQSTIKAISSRIQALPGQPSVRFGLVSYRDQREEYVTRKTDFTSDVEAFQAALDGVRAVGGGDKPEDMESGLSEAVNGLTWETGDTVRLSFLVADASPHIDYAQGTPYTTTMQRAASAGIKLFSIGTSSLEPEGEYAMRQLAQFTLAQYLFVTRGGDETEGGGGAASATVDKFKEGRLDDIVVDIVKAELGSLGR